MVTRPQNIATESLEGLGHPTGGAGMGQPPESPIFDALHQLSGALDGLDEVLLIMAKKIGPVCSPPPPSGAEDKEPYEPVDKSPVARLINEAAMRARRASCNLQELSDLVEL